jgi:hypothetical protein
VTVELRVVRGGPGGGKEGRGGGYGAVAYGTCRRRGGGAVLDCAGHEGDGWEEDVNQYDFLISAIFF